MSRKTVNGSALTVIFCALSVSLAAAQSPVGERAAGMAGAFVAVADDASAIYWNPAGLATGAFVSLVMDFGRSESIPEFQIDPAGAARQNVVLLAGSLPPVGLAYYRLDTFGAGPVTAVPDEQGRQEGRRSVSRLTTGNWGLALLHSINQYVVVGTTVKLVRGRVGQGEIDAVGAETALEAASDLEGVSKSSGDIDVSAMVAVEHVRIGVVARNLTTPEFPAELPGLPAVELAREVRVGAAWGSGWPGLSPLVVSLDADLMRRPTPSGDRRDIAGGVETWWLGRRLGLRGGVRGSTIGGARPFLAGGVSGAVTSSISVDAHAGTGDAGERSWGVGARFTF